MPTATVSKHLIEESLDETSLKKTVKPSKEHETKKAPAQQTDVTKVQESEGESPPPPKKPPKPKKIKEKSAKSSLSTIADAVVAPSNISATPSVPPSIPAPKKNAQRAKGSLSLNKTLEQAEQAQHQDKTAEKPVSKDSTDKIVVSKPEMAKPPGEGRKGSARPQKRKPKSAEEKETKPMAKQKPSEEEIEVKTSGDSPEVEITEVENQAPEPEEKKMEEVQVPPIGLSSCSFLEKLQQGVKAYFTSRSTINSEERAKKGGGIRTRASVAKGVKEDAKRKEPGFKLKNNISYSERNLLQDRLRVDMGGESCNFSDSNPKALQNFQKTKRKKLYQPKSHYVRIQIPRKGYFYRSNVQFQSPESKSSGRFQRSLPRGHQESKPKSPITGLAPSSSQISRLPNKKRVKKSVKNETEETDILEHLGSYISDCFSEKYFEWLKSRLEDHTLGVTFEEKIKKYVPLNLSNKTVECEKFLDEPENSETERDGSQNLFPENFKNCSGNTLKKADVSSDSDGESVPPVLKTDPLFEKIFDCINANLQREGIVYDQGNVAKETSNNPSISVNPCAVKERIPETINRKGEESLPLGSLLSNSATKFYNPGSFLMGGIDLHLELQNYLKAFGGSRCGMKTNLLKIHMSNPEMHVLKDDIEKINKKSCSSTSVILKKRTSTPLWVFFDLQYDLKQTSKDCFDSLPVKPFISQTQIFEKFDEMRRIKSEKDLRKLLQELKLKNTVKRTIGKTSFSVHRVNEISRDFKKLGINDSDDSCEKISTFRTSSDSAVRNKKDLSFSFSTDFGRQNFGKDSSDSGQPAGLLEKTSSSDVFLPQLFEILPKWSPTLYDLMEIYSSILNYNRKITKSSNLISDRSLSSDVISYLTTKVQEKHYKTKLIDLSKNYFDYYKVPKLLKVKKTKDLCGLEECVSAFQEILHSPLTIDQIAYMNNIISCLQETSQKMPGFVQDFKIPQKKKNFMKKAKPKSVNSKSFVTKRPKEPQRVPQSAQQNKFQKPAPLLKERIKKIKLETPTELEVVLNICFNTNAIFENSSTFEKQGKIKLDVKLLGNKILVDELSFFNNEKALSRRKFQQQESSELILENVTKETRDGIWYKHNKASKIRLINRTKEKLKTPKLNKPYFSQISIKPNNFSKPAKPKISTKPNNLPPMSAKEQKPEKDHFEVEKNECSSTTRKLQIVLEEEIKSGSESDSDLMTENEIQHSNPTKFLQFEYDQLRLRTQHPIEAIVESSESKIIEEEQPKPQSRKKEDVNHETDVTKPQMSTSKEIHLKDFTFELERNKVKPDQKTIQIKQKPSIQKTIKSKAVSKMRSMLNLEKNLKTKVSSMKLRSHSTYKCRPSSSTTLNKTPKQQDTKKRPETRLKPIQSMTKPSETVSSKRETEGQKIEKPEKTFSPLPPQTEENVAEELSKQEVADIPKTFDKVAAKPLVNAVLYLNNDISSDACSLEFPFSEVKRDTNFDGDPEDTFEMKPNDAFLDVELQESTISKSSDNTPITLYPKNSHADEFSFFSEVIHSDSFLTSLPNLTVSQSQIRSLSMSNPDLKFCPGRVTDNSKDFTPLITFVLTPSQTKLKGVPSNAVKVVQKNKINENNKVPAPEQDQKDRDQDTEMNEKPRRIKNKETYDVMICQILKDDSQLKPIEDFIKLLSNAKKSKSQKLEKKKVELKKKRVTMRTTKLYPQMKTSSLSCLSQIKFKCNGNTPGKGVKKSKSKIEGKPAEKYFKISENDKRKPEEKNKPMSSDLFLNKTVNTLLNTLENFQKGVGNERSQKVSENNKDIEEEKKEEGVKEKKNEKESDEVEEKKTNAKYDLMEKSIKFTNSTLEVEEMVENAISQAKAVTNKEGIIAAIKEGLGEIQQFQNSETKPKNGSKIKALMIKVFKIRSKEGEEASEKQNKFQQECQTQTQQEFKLSQQEECQPLQQQDCQYLQKKEQTDVLDLLVSRDTEDLNRKNSIYFDAEEKNKENAQEKTMAANEHQRPRTVGDTLDLNKEFGVKKEAESNLRFVFKIDLSKNTDEEIFDEILRCFEEGKIPVAMTLLDDIFSKMDEISDCDQLKKLLVLTQKKCKSLMMKIEKKAWFKVLTLLEEVSKTFEGQKEDLAVSQLETTKDFVDKIRLLNLQRLNNLQKFWSTFSQSEDFRIDNCSSISNIFNKIKTFSSLRFFKSKMNATLNTEKPRSESGFQINGTSSIRELPEAQKETEIQHLKRKLRQQKLYMEELMNAEDYTVFGEIQEIKSKIVEKINGLEKAFERENWEGFKATSSPKMTNSFRKESPGPSAGEAPFLLNGNYNYIDLVKSLITAWDASMPFRTFSSECFS